MLDAAASALSRSFEGYTLKDYIRLVIIIGAYMLFRHQYMLWRGRRFNEKQQEIDDKLKQEAEEEALNEAKEKEMGRKPPAPSAASTSSEWGWGNTAKTKMSKRRKYLESLARRQAEMQENDSDDEIADLLHN
ncbi:hypothetical protein DV451_002449 [Geotrichum candidum]|uniref:Processing of GAS1 and ALP protein 2 n=1 Tax=Geotrichum candidum TaxID=1173061 RepID=A0A9P5G6Z0_GEOCN|nr:hypothetical protein DV451_002449 [Geotrichum candidum]KAF5111545.1 hypothetical protein DV453_000190 [Geotrichum candidum]